MKRKQMVFIVSGLILAFLWTCHLIMGAWGIEIHRSAGDSMQPTLGEGAIYVVRKNPREISIGDIVTARVHIEDEISQVIKRVVKLNGQQVLLGGDFEGDGNSITWKGWVPVAAVDGKVVAILWRGWVKPPRRSPSRIQRRGKMAPLIE